MHPFLALTRGLLSEFERAKSGAGSRASASARGGLLVVVALSSAGCAHRSVVWLGGDVHFGTRAHHALGELRLDGPLVVNLEGPVCGASSTPTAERLCNPPESGALLRNAGVVAAGIANNHAADDGPQGVERTRATLEQARVTPLENGQVSRVNVLQVDLSKGVPADLEQRLQSLAHPSVVAFHVIAPPLYLPERVLEDAVARSVAAKVDVVVAHGSHAVAKVERRGVTAIAWGLGNLVFDCECTRETEGLLVRLEFDGASLARATVVPVLAGLDGAKARTRDDARLELDLLESLGSTLHQRRVDRADW